MERMMTDKIKELIIEKCVPVFLNDEKWKMNFTEILYSPEGGHELFESRIKKPLREFLETNPTLISEDGTPVKINDVEVKGDVRKLVTDEDISIMLGNKKLLHEKCIPHGKLKIEKLPSTIPDFISSEFGKKLLSDRIAEKDIHWFNDLYLRKNIGSVIPQASVFHHIMNK